MEINGDQLTLLNVLGLILCLGGICCHVIHKYTMFTSHSSSSVEKSDNDRQLVPSGYEKTTIRNEHDAPIKLNYRSGQNVPLLNEDFDDSDSDDLLNDKKNDSDVVLFDVLKRRDTRR